MAYGRAKAALSMFSPTCGHAGFEPAAPVGPGGPAPAARRCRHTRGRGDERAVPSPASSRWTWAQLLHRVFAVNVLACPFARLDTIPGVARRTAEVIAAELGCERTRFPTVGHAALWAGLCPGNHESPGKRLSGRTRHGNPGLCQALVEGARGAVRKRDSYLPAQYRRLVKHRGDRKALVAVAHGILPIAYHVLRDGQSHRELGGDAGLLKRRPLKARKAANQPIQRSTGGAGRR